MDIHEKLACRALLSVAKERALSDGVDLDQPIPRELVDNILQRAEAGEFGSYRPTAADVRSMYREVWVTTYLTSEEKLRYYGASSEYYGLRFALEPMLNYLSSADD